MQKSYYKRKTQEERKKIVQDKDLLTLREIEKIMNANGFKGNHASVNKHLKIAHKELFKRIFLLLRTNKDIELPDTDVEEMLKDEELIFALGDVLRAAVNDDPDII